MADDEQKALMSNYARNKAYAKQGTYSTALDPTSETQFKTWVQQNSVPFDPSATVADYDMRGFYQALMNKDPRAMTAIDPNDKQLHYPDYWKTPYHQTFSNESQWAATGAPGWNDKDQLVMADGSVVFDDRAPHEQYQDAVKKADEGIKSLPKGR